MPDLDDRSISQLTTAPDIPDNSLVELATPNNNNGYDSYKGVLSMIFDKILNTFSFTQRLNTTNKTVFGAINEVAQGGGGGGGDSVSWSQVVVSGTKIATITINNVATDVYAPEGGGTADFVELTQAEYDALEQAGEIDPTVMYFITDGQSGNEIIDDTTTSASKVWSSQKTNTEIATVAATVTEIAKATRSGLSHPAGVSYFTFTALPDKAGYSRMVIGANPSIADILYVRFTEVNGDLRVYMNNTTGAAATYDLTVAVAYIKN